LAYLDGDRRARGLRGRTHACSCTHLVGASVARKPQTGTTISYTDSDAAITTFTVLKRQTGVKTKRGVCIKPNRRPQGKRCTRDVSVGSFTHSDLARRDSFHFTGRLGGRTLKPGSYKLRAFPTANGMTG
jgi:hypothetical protein